MILRTAWMIACTALAYALLRGWPNSEPGVMKACFAVLAWVAGVAAWARCRTSKDEAVARVRRTARWPDYMAIGLAILAVEASFLWLLDAAPRPLESAGLAIERHFRPDAAALRAVNSGDEGTRSGNWLWTEETRRPLPKRTNFKPGTKPEVFVRLRDKSDVETLLKSKVFVRSFALGRYEASAWTPLTGRSLDLAADASGFVRIAPSGPGRTIHHEVFHSADAGGQNALTALQGVTAAKVSPLKRIDDGLFLLPPPTVAGGYQYEASSRPMRIEDLPDGGLVNAWPGAPDELLVVPENGDFGDRLRTLAHAAAGTGTLKEQLLHLQNHLRTSLAYSLSTTNPRNLDPLENFLFEERRGHCEYFATAGALMARALGLPSRVAYGWAGGTWYESSGLFVFRANEAHAWTEIWLENHGWVLMDPTPQSTGDARKARVAPADESLPGAEDGKPPTARKSPPAAVPPQVGAWLMLGFGIPAGAFALWRGSRKSPDDLDPAYHSGIPGPAAPGYLKLWHRACAARDMPMAPGSTLRQQVSRLPEAPDFAAELLDYHYGTRYEGRPPAERTEKQLELRIRQWEAGFSGINPPPGTPIRVS